MEGREADEVLVKVDGDGEAMEENVYIFAVV